MTIHSSAPVTCSFPSKPPAAVSAPPPTQASDKIVNHTSYLDSVSPSLIDLKFRPKLVAYKDNLGTKLPESLIVGDCNQICKTSWDNKMLSIRRQDS